MAQKKKDTKKKKDTQPKVSYHYKEEGMKTEDWQIALRQQIATKEQFEISQTDEKNAPGSYRVRNASSHREYKVVFRGKGSVWNYCSCMDFKTNQLGTCKHLEAVKLWMKEHRKKTHSKVPAYSSLYLSYKGKREIRLRIGTDQEEELRELAKSYFNSDGSLKPESIYAVIDFMREATKISDSFRYYPDALDYILDQRDKRKREFIAGRISDKDIQSLLKTSLYPYQKEGILFAFRVGKAIIADEMGLGKTIQAIGTAELLRKERLISTVLILCPTSLKYQWKKEIERFTDSTVLVVEGNHLQRKAQYKSEEFYKIVSYNSACNDIKIMGSLHTDLLIMDEVQRLKNWNTQIAKAGRRIESPYTVALSGTPLENKLDELYSIMQLVDQYCLGPYYKFQEETQIKDNLTGKLTGYKNLNKSGEKLTSSLLRRRKRDVALQLPERTNKVLFVPMTKEQRGMHEDFQWSVSMLVTKWKQHRFLSETDRKRLLLLLSQMRMVCDSTYILDQKSRHDTKIEETMQILHNVIESGDEKVVIFSQWERMTRLVAQELDKLEIRYEYLHGAIPSKERKNLVENFTEMAESRVFLSTDAGSTGLNLQVASILINLDLPWNPAVLEQRIARIYRIGQKSNIQVINMVASDTIEERMLSTLNFKSSLFEGVLDNGEDTIFLEDSKLDKIMETIETMNETEHTTTSGETIASEEPEQKRELITPPASASEEKKEGKEHPKQTELFTEMMLEEPYRDEEEEPEFEETPEKRTTGPKVQFPEELVQQGFSFFGELARTLRSPEATEQLVNSLIKEDPETGQTSLHIPVADKESVTDILKVIGTLFSGK